MDGLPPPEVPLLAIERFASVEAHSAWKLIPRHLTDGMQKSLSHDWQGRVSDRNVCLVVHGRADEPVGNLKYELESKGLLVVTISLDDEAAAQTIAAAGNQWASIVYAISADCFSAPYYKSVMEKIGSCCANVPQGVLRLCNYQTDNAARETNLAVHPVAIFDDHQAVERFVRWAQRQILTREALERS